jgi:phenylacetate-coenzyme A ligase PaaK-like adenylate-forming protein
MPEYWNRELETKPWSEVLDWQRERVAEVVPQLARRSRFYAEKLVGADPRALPFTTKDELRQGQEMPRRESPLGRQQAVALDDVVQVVSSSGTTGRPVYYGLTRADVEAWQDGIANSFFTAGVRPSDVVAHLVGLPVVAGGWSYAEGFRRIGAAVAWLGGLPTERILSSLPALGVTTLMATTSFALYLTEHARELSGLRAAELGVTKLLGGGEPGLGQPEIRERIVRAWETEHVRETMGLGDVLSSMWSECDDASGMHFNAQAHVMVELVDPRTLEPVPWEEGAVGEAVYTTLDRDATPVLRFRSSDHLLVTGTGCACRRTSPKVRCVGRTDDMLIYKGMNVFPTAIRDVVLRHCGDALSPAMRIWKETAEQVRFDTPIPLEVEARPEASPEEYAAIADRIGTAARSALQVRLAPTVVPPGALPRHPYKTPLVQVRAG